MELTGSRDRSGLLLALVAAGAALVGLGLLLWRQEQQALELLLYSTADSAPRRYPIGYLIGGHLLFWGYALFVWRLTPRRLAMAIWPLGLLLPVTLVVRVLESPGGFLVLYVVLALIGVAASRGERRRSALLG
jgi:hypothetical protein